MVILQKKFHRLMLPLFSVYCKFPLCDLFPQDESKTILDTFAAAVSITVERKKRQEDLCRKKSLERNGQKKLCIHFSKRNLDSHNKSCIMIVTEPTTPLIFHAQPGGTFSFMGCFMYQYPKQILTIA